MCDLCEIEHNRNHKFIYYKDLISEKDYKKNLNDLKTKIDEFKNVVIKQIIQLMENIFENYLYLSEILKH